LALFDFDGTISFRDSFAGFIKYVVGTARFYLGVVCLMPVVLGFLLGFIGASRAKEIMAILYFRGRHAAEIERLGSKYAIEELPKIVRKIALERIAWHKEKGDTVVVVTGSMDIWLRDWCAAQAVELIATGLEVRDGRITGRFSTKNCTGREKVRRIKERYDIEKFDYIYAYGDNPADRAMLAIADEGYYRWNRV
jgi:HAD superfamily hydrolase (TIGR01490 family)